jgi:hypothetical protein
MQHTATYCNTLQHTATHRNTLQHTATQVTNQQLGEYLIGMSCLLPMPQSYWPEDGCVWSVQVDRHRPSKTHDGGHAFLVLLKESTPLYSGGGNESEEFGEELSAERLRHGIVVHYGKGLTLTQMLDPAAAAHMATVAAEEEKGGEGEEYEVQRLQRMQEQTQLMDATGILQPALVLGAAKHRDRVEACYTKVEIVCCSVCSVLLHCVVIGVKALYTKVGRGISKVSSLLHFVE